MDLNDAPLLELNCEFKLFELLPNGEDGIRLEASGICASGEHFYIVFDNRRDIAKIHQSLTPGHPDNELIQQNGDILDFEGIAYHNPSQHFWVLNEARYYSDSVNKPTIEEFDNDLHFIESNWVNFAFINREKGMEGLAFMRRDGEDFALAICEGNKCKSGRKGRKPGGGRIQIFKKTKNHWDHTGTIKLPKSVEFEDYASLDIKSQNIAVVSQASSALWIAQFEQGTWNFVSDGSIFRFPTNNQGKTVYCNIEGVAWINNNQIAVVSDKRKSNEQAKRCRSKDQSLHIFNIPTD